MKLNKMKITKQWLVDHAACQEGIVLFSKHEKKIKTDRYIIEELVKINYFDWANWTVTKLLDERQKIKYAIFPAKLVLPVFEKECPKDFRPREAIESAEECLKDPNNKEKISAAYAAYAYAPVSASASVSASYAPVSASPAYASASAASASYATNNQAIEVKIMDYAMNLLGI